MKRFLVLLFLLPTLTYAQGAGTPPYRGVNNWNLIFGTDNVFDIGANAAQRPRTGYFGTSVITPALTVSGLTQTRVPFAGAGGLISDDADLTFDGTSLTAARVISGAGSCSAPGVRVGTDTDTGLIEPGAGSLDVCTNNAARYRFGSGGLFSTTAGITIGASLAAPDVGLFRIASGVLKVSNSAAGTVGVGFIGGGANVASATALPAPVANVYHVTGTTTITSITSTNIGTGTCIVLIFDGVLTLTDGSNLKLAGDFVTTADDTWTGCFDGTNWYETGRTVN